MGILQWRCPMTLAQQLEQEPEPIEGFAEYWVKQHYRPLKNIMNRIESNHQRRRRP